MDFVTGAKCGLDKYFFCRDVCIESHGTIEFDRHFSGKSHRARDVTYRGQMGMPIYNILLEPMELSDKQRAEYLPQLFVDLGSEYPFPEDLLPRHSQASSGVPRMTLVGCMCEFLRSGGNFTIVRRLWGHFVSSLAEQQTELSVNWSRSESLVSKGCVVILIVYSCNMRRKG